MNLLYKILLGVFVAALIVSLCGSLYYYNKINDTYAHEITYVFDNDPEYHFSLIVPDDGNRYWQRFKEGAYEAAKSKNSAIELNMIDRNEISTMTIELLEIATVSRLDGVIVMGTNTVDQDDAINEAMEMGVKVVVVGQETVSSNVYSYIGTNYYEYGVQVARLIKQLSSETGENARVGVFLSDESGSGDKIATTQNDILISGIKSVVEVEDSIDILLTKLLNSTVLGAEDIIRNILSDKSDVNVIFCTNELDTAVAARVIIERNLVGKVYIIGTGMSDSMANYVKKGIVYGTIDRNGYKAGMQSVELLINSFDHNSIKPDYIDIDIDIYTDVNVQAYKNGR